MSDNYDYKQAMRLESQLCFPLYAAGRQVIGLYTPYLKPLGITYTQYLVFLVLWEEDNLSVGDLCARLMLDNGTISPLLKKLQNEGFIEKKRSAEDDRVVVVSLTGKGRALQLKAKDIPLKVGSCINLTDKKAKSLYDLLYELINNNRRLTIKSQ